MKQITVIFLFSLFLFSCEKKQNASDQFRNRVDKIKKVAVQGEPYSDKQVHVIGEDYEYSFNIKKNEEGTNSYEYNKKIYSNIEDMVTDMLKNK